MIEPSLTEPTGPPPSDDDARVQEALIAFLEARAAGEEPDLDALCGGAENLVRRVSELAEREAQLSTALGVGRRERNTGPESLAEDEPIVGQAIGPYTLLESIGAGGAGRVFIAREEGLGRLVALKVIRSGTTDRATRLRFRREAEITAALDHPNIVPLYATGEDGGRVWIAMRLLGGPGLDLVEKPMAPRAVARIGAAVARALHAAHGIGVVHRDVKPANVVLSSGVPYLVDFGLARGAHQAAVTDRGAAPGTLPYMAPEQLERDDGGLDPRVDVYGLGATLYELLTGQPPFHAETPERLMREIITRECPRLGLGPRDRDLDVIVQRALSKEARRRFGSAQEFAEDLDRYLADQPIRSKPSTFTYRLARMARRNKVASIMLLVLIGSGIVLGFTLQGRANERHASFAAAMTNAASFASAGDYRRARELIEPFVARETEARDYRAVLRGREIVELLMDHLQSSMQLQSPTALRAFEREIEGAPAEVRTEPKTQLALCALDLVCGAHEAASRRVDRLTPYPRTVATFRAVIAGEDPVAALDSLQGAPASGTVAADDHVFATLALRLAEVPFSRQERELDLALDASFAHYRARYALGVVYHDRGLKKASAAMFSSLDEHVRHRPAVLTALARLDVIRDRPELARQRIGEARRLLADGPLGADWTPLRTVAMELANETGDREAFARELAAARRHDPDHPWIQVLEGIHILRWSTEGTTEARRGRAAKKFAAADRRGADGWIRRRARLASIELKIVAAGPGALDEVRELASADRRAFRRVAVDARTLALDARRVSDRTVAASAYLALSRIHRGLGNTAEARQALRDSFAADSHYPAANLAYVAQIRNELDAHAAGEATEEMMTRPELEARISEARLRAAIVFDLDSDGVFRSNQAEREYAYYCDAWLAHHERKPEEAASSARKALAIWAQRGKPDVAYLPHLQALSR